MTDHVRNHIGVGLAIGKDDAFSIGALAESLHAERRAIAVVVQLGRRLSDLYDAIEEVRGDLCLADARHVRLKRRPAACKVSMVTAWRLVG